MSKYSDYKDFTYPSADGSTEISAKVWEDEKVDPRAILQIAHGMVEYKERYNRFAKWMASRGILVCANDHLGHGESVKSRSDWGFVTEEAPAQVMTDDMHALRLIMHEKYPDLPYFMLGHSMGSFLLRKYLKEHAEGLNGAIIVGTGEQNALAVKSGLFLCEKIAAVKGWHYRSDFIRKLTFDKNYKKYDLTGKDKDNSWLTKDRETVAKYYQDPKCTYKFTLSGYKALFEAIAECMGEENAKKIPQTLNMLILSGSDDPVGAMGNAVKKVYDTFTKTGHRNVEMKLYPGDRHEILNETDRETVYEDIRTWILKHI